MSVRIRVYPQNGMLGMNRFGMNGMGGAVSASTYYNSKLTTAKQVSSLQLGYERALANERIERARLEERSKNPYLQGGFAGAMGGVPLGLGMGLPFGVGLGGMGGLPLGAQMGGLPMGGLPMGGLPMGGIPQGFAGSGQSNSTNQVSTGGATQTVTNSNVNNVSSSIQQPPFAGGWGGGWGGGFPGYGSGGLLSGLLGRLI